MKVQVIARRRNPQCSSISFSSSFNPSTKDANKTPKCELWSQLAGEEPGEALRVDRNHILFPSGGPKVEELIHFGMYIELNNISDYFSFLGYCEQCHVNPNVVPATISKEDGCSI